MKLPEKFYKQRRLVSDQIAACILIEPGLCPNRIELPRAMISDPNLVAMLRLAILNTTAYRIAPAAVAELGGYYVANLLKMLAVESHPAQAFVWHLDWYVYRLKQLEATGREFYRKELELAKFIADADPLLAD